MPDRGLMVPSGAPSHPLSGAHPGPWPLEDASICQLTFEVDQQAALGAMPVDATRPVPTYARLIVIDAPRSPAGPFRLASLFVGSRFQLMPRNVVVDAIVDGPADALAGAFGGGFRPGKVVINHEEQYLRIAIAGEEGDLGTIELPALRAVDPAMIRWDTWLGFGEEDGAVTIVELTPEVRATEAFLSKGATLDTPRSLARGHTWRRFSNLKTVTSCLVRGTITLPAPEMKQRWT